ncbi:MAG: glycine cleavage system aminomethyltransferase GcvT [Nitrospirota bacterium]
MNQTPLHEWHRAARAKMVEFAGWEMPLSYSGVLDEHRAVRAAAGLFDISHMGRIAVEGAGAEALLQRLVTRNLASMADGSARYALVCRKSGGVLDDVVVYRRAAGQFFVVVNASNRQKIVQWFQHHAATDSAAQVWDLSDAVAMIAVQGPLALGLLERAGAASVTAMKRWHLAPATVAGVELLLATTGYTGEPGAELFLPSDRAPAVWETLLTAGKAQGVKPVGLGARDTLRLEMGYSLYGHEIDETITPLEAGLEWAVDLDRHEFIGREALRAQRGAGLARRLAAFMLPDRAVPRQGYRLFHADEPAGVVTSGNLSPMLERGIGLGFLPPAIGEIGAAVAVEIRQKRHPATIVSLPFYQGGHA